MRKDQARVSIRVVAAGLLTAAVVGISAVAMHAPTQNRNALARPLKSIQTDQAIQFQAFFAPPDRLRCVERTGETRLSAENLKLIAAAF
jgi:hypothetical protein